MTPEAKIKKQIKSYLIKTYPDSIFFFPASNRYSQIGVSDLIGCIDGKFIAIEVKTNVGRVTEMQRRFIDSVLKAGGVAGVCRSVEDVEELLKNRIASHVP